MREKRQDHKHLDSLRMVAPGTPLREALSRILGAHMGALIVLGDDEKVLRLLSGGVELNWPFNPSRLYQVCKMDGAVVLDEGLSTIRFANVLLIPDPSIPSRETGTRHVAAERVARQTGKLVIAVSERMSRVTLYREDWSHVMQEVRVLVSKATQALQALERYKERFDQVAATLTALEFEGLVTLYDVAIVIQRAEMMQRISEEIEVYLAELGVEGRLIRLQMEELMFGVEKEKVNVIRDYMAEERGKTVDAVERSLSRLDGEELLELTNVVQALGFSGAMDELDRPVVPRGYRILEKIPRLPSSVVEKVVRNFGDLPSIMEASTRMLEEVDGVGRSRAQSIKDGLRRLVESSIVERFV